MGEITTGQSNIRIDDPRDAGVCRFKGQFDDRRFAQHVTGAIHVHDHMLEVVVTGDVGSIIQDTTVIDDPCFYDVKGN